MRAVLVAWAAGLAIHLVLMQTLWESGWVSAFGALAYGLSALAILAITKGTPGFRLPSALLTGLLANSVHLLAMIVDPPTPEELPLALPMLAWAGIIAVGHRLARRGLVDPCPS